MDTAALNEARRRKRKSRGRGLRKTTGCITCRRRHLKCDEISPICGPCTKSRQNCLYANTAETQEDGSSASVSRATSALPPDTNASPQPNGENARTQTSLQQIPLPQPSAAIASSWQSVYPEHDRARQAASGLLHLNSGGLYDASYSAAGVMSPPVVPYSQASNTEATETAACSATTPPDAAFYRWFGLLANDAVHDDTGISRFARGSSSLPDESAGAQALSVRPATRRATIGSYDQPGSHLDRYPAPFIQNPPPDLLQAEAIRKNSWQGSEPAKLRDHEHVIFQNFVTNVSTWIDLFDPTKCFSNFTPHLAMHDAGLMNAILALSSRHLSLSPDAKEEQRDRNIGLQYYYETLHYLQKAMQYDTYTVSLELLATALIVSTYEMLDDSGSGWERHLKGVFWIQRSQVIQGESGGLKQAVWWAWLRQDVWAAFREKRKTLSFWKPTRALNVMTPYELASRSVWIFAKAVDYCSNDEIKAGEENLQSRIERADVIFSMLDDWQRHLTTEFTPLPMGKKSPGDIFDSIWIHPPAFGVSMQLHCAARILILLHRPSFGGMRGYMEQQKLLTKAVETICGIAITLTDDASSVMSSQCLYIAGLCIQDASQRGAVLSMIDSCHQRIGWPTKSLSEDLKSEWAKMETQ
ncbi:Zn(II)2Cys6 transcription factor [Phlyctema vagabunda]|uniref:Zn(II)2Cys6 transcription factor n=1 Tax=Phlyctema vagabunda TaxID=108571 RepID=A0ABR4PQD8_9HELO